MKIILLLLLGFANTANTVESNRQFNLVDSAETGIFNSFELRFLRENGFAIIPVLQAGFAAHNLTARFCGAADWKPLRELEGDDVMDSMRHFLFASKLGESLGTEKAIALLNAHEMKKNGQQSYSNLMDHHNNQRGLEFFKKNGKTSWQEKLQAAIVGVRDGRLQFLHHGPTRCAKIPSATWDQIKSHLNDFFAEFERLPFLI